MMKLLKNSTAVGGMCFPTTPPSSPTAPTTKPVSPTFIGWADISSPRRTQQSPAPAAATAAIAAKMKMRKQQKLMAAQLEREKVLVAHQGKRRVLAATLGKRALAASLGKAAGARKGGPRRTTATCSACVNKLIRNGIVPWTACTGSRQCNAAFRCTSSRRCGVLCPRDALSQVSGRPW